MGLLSSDQNCKLFLMKPNLGTHDVILYAKISINNSPNRNQPQVCKKSESKSILATILSLINPEQCYKSEKHRNKSILNLPLLTIIIQISYKII